MAEFSSDDTDKVNDVMRQYLSNTWDISSINEAPEIAHLVNDKLGSLKKGQLLLASDTDQDACLLCAWWPWGNGGKVSIRVIPTCRRVDDEDIAELRSVFKSWFGL
jgi:hypothetical protein